MSAAHFTLKELPSKEKELLLAPIGSPFERLVYSAVVLSMHIGGIIVLPHFMGWALIAVGAIGGVALYRTTQRQERWVLSRGSATRFVTGFGASTENYAPSRVLATRRTDEHGRKVVRVELEHQSGKVNVGPHEFDDDERAAALAQTVARELGVEIVRA